MEFWWVEMLARHRFYNVPAAIGMGLLFACAAFRAEAAVEAVAVCSDANHLTLPHSTYDGASITLKAIARGGATEYKWSFDDGRPDTPWTRIANPYNLGITHVYRGQVGDLFQATISVRRGNEIHSDRYPVRIELPLLHDLRDPGQMDVRVRMSIDEALWNLHKRLQRYSLAGHPAAHVGLIHPDYQLAETASLAHAFHVHGHFLHGDYDEDPYVETVQRAWHFLFTKFAPKEIGTQVVGKDPDTNGNGIGIYVANRYMYTHGMVHAALAACGTPDYVAPTGPIGVKDRAVREIVQDIADYSFWAQDDSTYQRGGWRYSANGGGDLSALQWPAYGIILAEHAMGTVVPDWVKEDTVTYLNRTQYLAKPTHQEHGSFGYDQPLRIPNVTKAAAGITAHKMAGTPVADHRMRSAYDYIYTYWNDQGPIFTHSANLGSGYSMYDVMRAMTMPNEILDRVEEYDPGTRALTGNSFDWFYWPHEQANQGIGHYIITHQRSDGGWLDSQGYKVQLYARSGNYTTFPTSWRVIILTKRIAFFNQPPVADAGVDLQADCDGVQLQASASDPDERDLLTYFWSSDCGAAFHPSAQVLNPMVTLGPASGERCELTLTVSDGTVETSDRVVIRLDDQTAPSITLLGPQVLDLECGEPFVEPGFVAEAAAGGDLTDQVRVTSNLDLERRGFYDVAYEVSDSCGNAAERMIRTVRVVDTTPPSFTPPPDLVVECGATKLGAAASPSDLYDRCSAVMSVHHRDVSSRNLGQLTGTCETFSYTITRTWTVTDAAGNAASKDQLITFADTTPPKITTTLATAFVDCSGVQERAIGSGSGGHMEGGVAASSTSGSGGFGCAAPLPVDLPPAPQVTAIDDCDPAVVVTRLPDLQIGDCPGTIIREWVATDRCGWSDTLIQMVILRKACVQDRAFWICHPESWLGPMGPALSLNLDGSLYQVDAAREILCLNSRGDKTIALAQELIAASLNVLQGADDSCASVLMAEARAYLSVARIGSDPQGELKRTAGNLAKALEGFNRGHCCAPTCLPESSGSGCAPCGSGSGGGL